MNSVIHGLTVGGVELWVIDKLRFNVSDKYNT